MGLFGSFLRGVVSSLGNSGVTWYCDGCNSVLNGQPGFSTSSGTWVCTKCGEVNDVSPGNVFGSEEEFQAAIHEMRGMQSSAGTTESLGERLYTVMIQAAGPTTEQTLASLSPEVIYAMAKRAEEFKALPAKELKALKSFGAQRRRGKVLSEKQVSWMKSMFERMVEAKAIVRNGIDSDQELCDIVLDALEL